MTRTLLALLLLLALTACADGTAVGTSDPQPSDAPTDQSDDTPIPVEPDGGIGDGATPLPDQQSQPAGDEPIPVEADGGIGDGAGPPAPLAEAHDFGVSSETDSASIAPFAACWTVQTPGEDATSGTCFDGDDSPTTTLEADAQLVVTYAEGDLTATTIGSDGTDGADLPVVVENPGIYLVDVSGLEPGTHDLRLTWVGAQGDSSASVTLQVS